MSLAYDRFVLQTEPDHILRMYAWHCWDVFCRLGYWPAGANHVAAECLIRGLVPEESREPPMRAHVEDYGRPSECANTAEK